MSAATDLAYKPGELTEAQLTRSTRDLFAQNSMNVFRRYPREKTAEMVKFYTEALALRSLNPIQLTATQQMILTGVGSGQIKLRPGSRATASTTSRAAMPEAPGSASSCCRIPTTRRCSSASSLLASRARVRRAR
jgi:hypothetical protein